MSNLVRKIEKKKRSALDAGPGKGPRGTPKARVIMRPDPETGLYREFHLTKGWR